MPRLSSAVRPVVFLWFRQRDPKPDHCLWMLDPDAEVDPKEGFELCRSPIAYWVWDAFSPELSGLCAQHTAELRQMRPEWIARIESAV